MSDEPIFIHSIRRDMERTPHNRGGIIEHKPLSPGVGKCGTYGDNLVREWDEVASEHGERCPIRWNEQSKCDECGRAVHGWVHGDHIGGDEYVIHDWGWSHEGDTEDGHAAIPVAPVGLADPELAP